MICFLFCWFFLFAMLKKFKSLYMLHNSLHSTLSGYKSEYHLSTCTHGCTYISFNWEKGKLDQEVDVWEERCWNNYGDTTVHLKLLSKWPRGPHVGTCVWEAPSICNTCIVFYAVQNLFFIPTAQSEGISILWLWKLSTMPLEEHFSKISRPSFSYQICC